MAVRKVQTVSSTGSSDSYRVRVNLTIRVTKVCLFAILIKFYAVKQTLFPFLFSSET